MELFTCNLVNRTGQARAIRAVLVLLAALWLAQAACRFSADADTWHTVAHVNDGDTVVLGGAEKQSLRYLGIDTPEIDHRRHTAEPFGFEARKYNQKLVLNKKIRLEFDKDRTDRYGRWLAYVFLEDGTFVNQEILAQGLGFCYFKQPNTRYQKTLLESQRSAMSAKRGMWKGWSEADADYIGNRHSRLFHRSSCPNGKKVSFKNRHHFVNQWEAFWDGYAPARGCLKGGREVLE